MKEIVIISGKGGTGKTSITAAFAAIAERKVLVDCDVDAADLHLVMSPKTIETYEFSGGKTAQIIEDHCSNCGNCNDLCRFEAVNAEERTLFDERFVQWRIDPVYCEGCGVCELACPSGAISLEDAVNGYWFRSETRFGPLIHAQLGIAEENSGKLVNIIKKEARKHASKLGYETIIVDGPPGIGCPVISSLSGASFTIVVTEPTVSGVHDFERVLKLAAHFKVQTGVIINKFDLNPDYADEIKAAARLNGSAVIAELMYDRAFTEAQLAGKSIVEYREGPTVDVLYSAWDRVMERLGDRVL